MLLVKSKELKNSNSKNPSSPLLAGFYSLSILAFSSSAWAQEESQGFSSSGSILSVFLSLLVVIAIIFALAFIMRRFNVAQAGNGQMKVVASMMAGNKEKIMVIEVGDEQHLLGITAHNISHLATLQEPLESRQASGNKTQITGQQGFQQKLVMAMADAMSGGKSKTQKANTQGAGNE